VDRLPPPEDFDGIEDGDYGSLDYRRSLTDAEQAVIDAELAIDHTAAEARRDRYFSLDEPEDFSSLQAELSSTSGELSDAGSPIAPLPAREGLGVGAAEALGSPQQDHLDHPVDILDHVGIPEPDDSPPSPFEEPRPHPVPRVIDMLPAVDLDDKLRLPAGEVDDIGRDRKLPGEAWPVNRQPPPQDAFAVGGVGPKITSF
jgi:hypothetical protein